jgi:hypothetical protein
MEQPSEARQGRGATVLDLDDFSLVNHRLDLLDRLKEMKPGLKVTLFSVPAPDGVRMEDNLQFLRWVKDTRPWVELAVHGWCHAYLECQRWTKEDALKVLELCENEPFVKGFKCPYWAVSEGVYLGCMERSWWLADHEKNNGTRPARLPVYLLDRRSRVHGHVQDIGSNGLQEAWGLYANLEGPFYWISEVMEGRVDA